MLKWRGFAPFIVIGILGLVWMLVVSEQGANWLTSKFSRPSDALPVARVLDYSGGIKIISNGRVFRHRVGEPSAAKPPIAMLDGDRLEVDKGGRAVFSLNSGDEMSVEGLASILFHLWNPKDAASPVYVHDLQGDLKLVKAGVRGHAFIMREGRLYFPGQKPSTKPMALTVLRTAPLDMQLAADVELGGSGMPGDAADESAAAEKPAKEPISGVLPETLSNEYIDETISSRQGQLQKCWLSRLKDNPTLKGQVTLQFEISNRGMVREMRVNEDSTITDETLRKCVMTVIERIPFRPYRGTPIALTYPLTFE